MDVVGRPRLSKYIKAKCLLNALLSASRGNWGPRPDITKWIYTGIVRPSVSYASAIWAHDISLKKTAQCLDALDRFAMRSLTHSAQSCPTRGLAVVFDLLPLPLFLRHTALCTALGHPDVANLTWRGRTQHLRLPLLVRSPCPDGGLPGY